MLHNVNTHHSVLNAAEIHKTPYFKPEIHCDHVLFVPCFYRLSCVQKFMNNLILYFSSKIQRECEMRFFNTVYCYSYVFWSKKVEVRKQRAEIALGRVSLFTQAIQHMLGRINDEHWVGYDKDERKKKWLQRIGGRSLQNDHKGATLIPHLDAIWQRVIGLSCQWCLNQHHLATNHFTFMLALNIFRRNVF